MADSRADACHRGVPAPANTADTRHDPDPSTDSRDDPLPHVFGIERSQRLTHSHGHSRTRLCRVCHRQFTHKELGFSRVSLLSRTGGNGPGLAMAFYRVVALRALGASAVLALSGCALTAPSPDGVVEVADVINSVKCGLAQALQSEAGQRRLPGTIATVDLDLKVADTRSFGASSPFTTGPVIFAWAGPLVLPNLSAVSQQSFTVDTSINLTYKLDGPNVSVCAAAGVDTNDKFGFARWLGEIIAGLSKVSLQGPKGSLNKLTYDATFAVTRGGSGGASVKLVFVDAGATAARSRADVQHLKIVISGPNAVATSVSGADAVSGGSIKSSGSIQNLSGALPAPR
jgi:Trypsin-co-occurring domain 2